jgi:hypothetical protein
VGIGAGDYPLEDVTKDERSTDADREPETRRSGGAWISEPRNGGSRALRRRIRPVATVIAVRPANEIVDQDLQVAGFEALGHRH